MPKSSRIAIVGAGNVGAANAYALMLCGLFSEIVLIDSNPEREAAEAADIADANPIARPSRIWAGSFADVSDAGLVVLTAGATTHSDEPRTSVAVRSASIVRDCVTRMMTLGFDGIIVVVSKPVDVMAHVAQIASGIPSCRVIGTGTLLDSNRFRRRIADALDLAHAAVDAFVLDEHGDSEVVAFSTVCIGGMSLEAYLDGRPLDRSALTSNVTRSGYEIMRGKGYTSYGVATAIVRICKAIHRDERVVLPVTTKLAEEYGTTDVHLSLPCLLGTSGRLRVLNPDLTLGEREGLAASAEALRGVVIGLSD